MRSKSCFMIFAAAIILMLAVTTAVSAEDKPKYDTVWTKTVDFGLALAQTAYSDSWAGGEAGNFSWVSNLNNIFNGPVTSTWYFKSTNKLAFGQTHVQDAETKKWAKPTKSTDLIDLEQILNYRTQWQIDPYVAFRFESQFLDASVEAHKRIINPMTLTESIGFTHRFYGKEKQFIDTRLGFALRELISRDFVDTIDYKTETNSLTDGGLESVTDVNVKLHENIKWTSKLTLYKALAVSDDKVDNWSSLDASWENILGAKVTKYITVLLYFEWLYDQQVDKRAQIKETLALGVTFSLL